MSSLFSFFQIHTWGDFLRMEAFPLELLCATAPFVLPLRRRRGGLWRIGAAAVMLLGASLIFLMIGVKILLGFQLYISDGVVWGRADVFYILWYTFLFFATMFAVWFCFRVNATEAVYCVSMAYAAEHIAYCIRVLLNALTDSQVANAGSFWHLLIHGSVYVVAYVFFARQMVKGGHYETDAVSSMSMTLVTLFIVLFMSMTASMHGFLTAHGVYGLVCCLFILINQRNHMLQWNLRQELFDKEQLWMMNRAQYELSRENIELINKKCHDLRHQIDALRTISDVKERQQVVDSIRQSVMIYDSILHTGNTILDTVLTEKSLLCNEHQIAMHGMIDGKLLYFMDGVDLYTLFGNALENAIEGNLKVQDVKKRCISVLVHEKVNVIFIQIENPYEGQLQFHDGLPETDKQDKNYHGFGVKSIRDMAEKYGGFITIETDQNIFVLRITIPRGR